MVFISIFLAELGDKTQVATLLFATDQTLNKLGVILASSGALVLSTVLAVFIGGQIATLISPEKIRLIAGIGFLAIGLWTLLDNHGAV